MPYNFVQIIHIKNSYLKLCLIRIIISLRLSFSHHLERVVFRWSLSEIKFIHVSRTHVSIQPDLKNAMVWKVPILPLVSKSSSLFLSFLSTSPSTLTTINITVTLMSYSFCCFFFFFVNSLTRFNYLFIFSLSFTFSPLECQNPQDWKYFLFLFLFL